MPTRKSLEQRVYSATESLHWAKLPDPYNYFDNSEAGAEIRATNRILHTYEEALRDAYCTYGPDWKRMKQNLRAKLRKYRGEVEYLQEYKSPVPARQAYIRGAMKAYAIITPILEDLAK